MLRAGGPCYACSINRAQVALVAVAVHQGIHVGGSGGPITYEQQQGEEEAGGVAAAPREVRRIAFGSCTCVPASPHLDSAVVFYFVVVFGSCPPTNAPQHRVCLCNRASLRAACSSLPISRSKTCTIRRTNRTGVDVRVQQ